MCDSGIHWVYSPQNKKKNSAIMQNRRNIFFNVAETWIIKHN